MNNCSKIILTIGLAVTLQLGMYPTTNIAMSAVAPVISVRPAITSEISTPMRLATDSVGNVYATDSHAGGVLQYNSSGSLVKKYVTPKSVVGVAIAQDGSLLVTQRTYVAVINSLGNEINRFGTFLFANGIAIDSSNNIYVTDSRSNTVTKFNSSYVQQASAATSLVANARPAGIAFDKYNNRLAIANSSEGTIQFVNPADLSLLDTVGTRGYDPAPVYPTSPSFSYPQGVSFEYNATSGVLERIYVAETFQANIQVLDATTNMRIADIGGYGFDNGKLFVPSDVLYSPASKKLFVANGGGTLAVYGVDGPTNSYVLTLATNGGNGAGTINGSTAPSGISVSCGENATCQQSTPIPGGETVTITATENALTSIFGSWAGVCAGTVGKTCIFTMDSDKTATASFTLRKQFNVNGAYYDDLQAAYNAAADGSVIKIMAGGPWTGNIAVGTFTADQAKTVTLKGGYDSQYSEPAVAGNTTITGRINVKAGKVIMNNVRTK